jgi:hypothetical protein
MQTRHSGLSERTPLGPPTRVCSAHSPWTTDLASGCVVVELSQYHVLVRTFAHRASRRTPGAGISGSVTSFTSEPHLRYCPPHRSHTAHVLGAKTKLVMYNFVWGRYRVFTHYCFDPNRFRAPPPALVPPHPNPPRKFTSPPPPPQKRIFRLAYDHPLGRGRGCFN